MMPIQLRKAICEFQEVSGPLSISNNNIPKRLPELSQAQRQQRERGSVRKRLAKKA